jgi:hypothetical protein
MEGGAGRFTRVSLERALAARAASHFATSWAGVGHAALRAGTVCGTPAGRSPSESREDDWGRSGDALETGRREGRTEGGMWGGHTGGGGERGDAVEDTAGSGFGSRLLLKWLPGAATTEGHVHGSTDGGKRHWSMVGGAEREGRGAGGAAALIRSAISCRVVTARDA